jgi:hypothetical protein
LNNESITAHVKESYSKLTVVYAWQIHRVLSRVGGGKGSWIESYNVGSGKKMLEGYGFGRKCGYRPACEAMIDNEVKVQKTYHVSPSNQQQASIGDSWS